ncbi:hypothetical protein ABTX81_23580 [Kitasatospora sp. NPDC097605]|uniref:hypothetical protein n=1 Tax=Kitasatospora sp. NPDC097605 TaxID=3157226 RepID=UPI003323107C
MVYIWEDALTFLGSSADKAPTKRADVVDDEKPWLNTDVRKQVVHAGWQGVQGDGTDLKLDSWVAWYFTYTEGKSATVKHGSYVVGTSVQYPNLDGPGAKFAGWTASRKPLEQFIDGSVKANDRLDPAVFTRAADTLKNFSSFLDGWITAIGTEWVKGIGEEDGDWQGSAANAMRTLLLAFRNEMDADNRMIRLAAVDNHLRPMDQGVKTWISQLWEGFKGWWGSPLAWPTNAVTAALMEGLKGATLKIERSTDRNPVWHSREDPLKGAADDYGKIEGGGVLGSLSITVTGAPFGDPKSVDFWKQVDKRARQIWLANVVKWLDTEAERALTGLTLSYTAIGNAARPLKPFPLMMPDPKAPEDPTKDPTKDGGKDGGKDDPDKTIDELNKKINEFGNGGGGDKDGGPSIKDITGGGSGGSGNMPNLGLGEGGSGSGSGNTPNLNLGGGSSGSGGSGSTPNLNLGNGGSGSTPNLNLGNGGSTPNLDLGTGGSGSGSGPNLIGNPFPGLNSGPLPDSLLPGGTGSNRPVVVPPSSVITKDGRIVDESGNPVLDSAGNPMVAGPGYTIGPDGILRDGDGNTVSQYRQLLADRYSAAGIDGSGSGDDLLTPNEFGTGGFSYNTMGLGAGGSGAGGSLGLGGSPMITGMGGGLSNRALAAGGDPSITKAAVDQANAERAAAERAARAAAQEQAALTGRQTPTTSSGMPPMMPPGAGMGGAGAGAGGEKDRRRTTWLAEDEEVWGTQTGAVEGVIGR